MIFVPRAKKPKILEKHESSWTDKIKELKAKYDANSTKTNKELLDKAIKKYNHRNIKETLEAMFNGKCAFCESFIQNVDFGDIEHFRPKSIFPELAVKWENLVLACKKCNGSGQKGNNWPLTSSGGILIDPCIDDPNNFFDFEFDETTLVSIVKPKNERGEISEKCYGLNKHELLVDRNKYVKMLIVIAKRYSQDVEAKEILEEAITNKGEYSAFAKVIKSKYVVR